MIPHERSLVQRYNGRPFALLGVNSDKNPDQLKADLTTHQVNWKSFKNQKANGEKISTAWQVRGWPALFLIDHKGVIRHKWVGAPKDAELERAIEALVQEAERDKA